jgi:large subunit ribosomal protein L29
MSAAMDAKAFRELSEEELTQKLRDLRDDLFKLKLRASTTQLENPSRIRQLRREIARGETVLRELARRPSAPSAGQAP